MGICKNNGTHCRNTKVPGKVQSELVNSKHAPICNERSCDIVIVLLDFVVVLLDFVVGLPDFVVESNRLCEHISAQTINVLLTLALCTTIFLLFGSSKILACQYKRDSPLPLN